MLDLIKLNAVTSGVTDTLETQVPSLRPISIGTVEIFNDRDLYAPVALHAIVGGGWNAKLSIAMDWDAAYQCSGQTSQEHPGMLDERSLGALETLFFQCLKEIATQLEKTEIEIQYQVLPKVLDNPLLLRESEDERIIKIPFVLPSGKLDLYLSV